MKNQREPLDLASEYCPEVRAWLDSGYESMHIPAHLRATIDNFFRLHPWELSTLREQLGIESLFIRKEETP